MSSRFTLTILLLLVALGSPAGATRTQAGSRFPTVQEALALAFPKAELEHERVFLDKVQAKRIAKLSKCKVESRIVHRYHATKDGVTLGTAYLDGHKVRTKRETLLVILDPEARVRRVEVLAFAEPPDYVLDGAWYAQFKGKRHDDPFDIKRGIRGVTGSTLTARASTRAVRRVLISHEVLRKSPSPATARR